MVPDGAYMEIRGSESTGVPGAIRGAAGRALEGAVFLSQDSQPVPRCLLDNRRESEAGRRSDGGVASVPTALTGPEIGTDETRDESQVRYLDSLWQGRHREAGNEICSVFEAIGGSWGRS